MRSAGAVRAKVGTEDLVLQPTKCQPLEGCVQVATGIDFTMFLAGGKLYGAGNPQFGTMGDGDDHSYNAKDCE